MSGAFDVLDSERRLKNGQRRAEDEMPDSELVSCMSPEIVRQSFGNECCCYHLLRQVVLVVNTPGNMMMYPGVMDNGEAGNFQLFNARSGSQKRAILRLVFLTC